MSNETTLERVRRMVAPVVADLRLDLYDVEFRGGTLRVTVDTPPGSAGGVDLETLTLVTKMLSRDLDHDDPMPGHYTLEVTSPGLERTLRTPTHFQREVGKTVAIRLRDVVQGERRLQGVLVAADEQSATIRADDLTDRVVTYDQIDRARTVFVWGPAPKPGKGPGKAKAAPKAQAHPVDTGDAGAPNATSHQEAQ
jgi:ribosome maturation factor RimP